MHHFQSNLSPNTSNNASSENYKAGSALVKKTVQFCNGPYFSYQINNLVVLPFSLSLLIIFSCFNNSRNKCCLMRRSNWFSCTGANRPDLPGAVNPFQRRNRFLAAALFCIIANEIFKMIETSMFNVTVYDDGLALNRTEAFFSNSVGSNSNTDFLRIGLGIKPKYNEKSTEDLLNSMNALGKTTTPINNSTRPLFILAPSVMRYSKPKLPPRLSFQDFQTTTNLPSKSTIIAYFYR